MRLRRGDVGYVAKEVPRLVLVKEVFHRFYETIDLDGMQAFPSFVDAEDVRRVIVSFAGPVILAEEP